MTRSEADVFAAALARILLGGFFIFSGFDNLLNLFVTANKMPIAGAVPLLVIAAFFKIILGTALAIRYHTKYAALALAIYLSVVSLWLYGPQNWGVNELYQFIFLRNAAIVGGLLFIYAHSRGFALWNEEFIPDRQKMAFKQKDQ